MNVTSGKAGSKAGKEKAVGRESNPGNFFSGVATQPIAEFRTALEAANYSEAGVKAVLGGQDDLYFQPVDIAVAIRRLPEDLPLSTLVKLFLLGVTVEEDEVAKSLRPMTLQQLLGMGLAQRTPKGVRPLVRLFPYQGFIIVSDPHYPDPSELPSDYVIGVNATSVTLAHLTVRTPVGAVLDMGTGCGVQALLAARQAGQVVATDVNAKALGFTAFNAQLNGIHNIQCRQGSFFQPVAGNQFDLIVSNPPYVISPDTSYIFRDGGLPGDSVSAEVVKESPAFLAEGGFAHILCNWTCRSGEEWSAPVRRWIESSGCNALLLHYKTEDPLTYAANWTRSHYHGDLSAYQNALDRWLSYYQKLGIEAIASGAVILRRSKGPHWTRAEQLPPGTIGPAGEHIVTLFQAQDYLVALQDDRAILAQSFRLVEHHRLEQVLKWRNGAYGAQDMVLALERGLRFQGRIDGFTLHLLAFCDGRRLLGEAVEQVAQGTGTNANDLAITAIDTVKKLLGLGFLAPAQGSQHDQLQKEGAAK